jgi:hypothetical protein
MPSVQLAYRMDERPQLDWHGSKLQDEGLLQLQKGWEPIELHFFSQAGNPAGDSHQSYLSIVTVLHQCNVLR